MKHFAWDYEDSVTKYYHIYPVSDAGDDLLIEGPLSLVAPETEDNSRLVGEIVQRLDQLAETAT